jgi:hypothetical protein
VFEVTILAFPTVKPITALNMNYSSIITIGVVILSGIWYILGAHKHYAGPRPNVEHESALEESSEVMMPAVYDDQKINDTKEYPIGTR